MKIIVRNKIKKADYEIYKEYTCGIELKGWEVKSLRRGEADLKRSFCLFKNQELFLHNAHIACWMLEKCYSLRTRKLLLNRWELKRIKAQMDQNKLILIPLIIFLKRNLIKLKIVTAKKRKKYQSKIYIKERQIKRETQKEREKFI